MKKKNLTHEMILNGSLLLTIYNLVLYSIVNHDLLHIFTHINQDTQDISENEEGNE